MKEFVMSLVRAESEKEVIRILKDKGYWDDHTVWRNYGDNENNFSTIGNQQGLPESALVEKLINSVDAVLMRECLERQIDPESKDAPQSIPDALREFYSIREGKLANLDSKTRRSLSENIYLVATGSKSNPCYSIIDKGEGILPARFPDTILSISKSNKLRIPFVQGKFNMGGTGVLQFCGKSNLQLIISKRSSAINIYDPDNDYWGCTLVRREPPSGGHRSSVYKYLAPGNEVLKFQGDTLPLIPDNGTAYKLPLQFGTFIKLYEYQISSFRTNILFDLYYRLSLLMPGIALPIRLAECRDYEGHSMQSTISGLNVRLEEDKRNNIEPEYPATFNINISNQRLKAVIYVFKSEKDINYRRNEGILFTINGQTHGSISKAFFSRKAVGLGYLADSLLVIVDCTEIDAVTREDLFMNSRDRLRDGDLKRAIEKELENAMRNHCGLRGLQQERRRQAIEDKIGDSKPLAEVLEQVIKKSPTLFKLFLQGTRLSNPFNLTNAGSAKEFLGKDFPTYFEILAKDRYRHVPINKRARIQFETDANNSYFYRDSQPGEFKLELNGKEVETYSLNLFNGIATLMVTLPSQVKVGTVLNYRGIVSDETKIKPLENEFQLEIDPAQQSSSGSSSRVSPPGGKGVDRKTASMLSLPVVKEVYKEGWSGHGFNRESALRVVNNDTSYDFYVNMDNIHLQTEIKEKTGEVRYLKAKYKFGMALIGLGLLNAERNADEDENITEKVFNLSSAISPILLPMLESLGSLEDEFEEFDDDVG
ncbi:MAG: hypothetical protein PHG58_03265 [Clostridia bacterium]|nr:hypothetical protein [Clostridia bacterium]